MSEDIFNYAATGLCWLLKQARKLQDKLVQNYHCRLTYLLTGVKCRATSEARNREEDLKMSRFFVKLKKILSTGLVPEFAERERLEN